MPSDTVGSNPETSNHHSRRHSSIPVFRIAAGFALAAGLIATPRHAVASVSLGGISAHSPDDISGFTTLSGDDATASVALPFTFTIEGTNYTTLVLSTNGWIEFGANTSGSADFSNACLPVANHTNPFLAAYWDDLVTFGTNVRYGTVGTSPNRTFIADYEVDLFSGSEGSDDIRFQVQLHERSNMLSVRYRDQQSATNGIAATIGFQGAGGAAATTVQPLTCNGKILDDNRPNEGWSADVGRAGNVTLAAVTAFSPDDISGFTTLTGDENVATVALPFTVTLEGINYAAVAISTNGWIEFGANTSGSADFVNAALPVANHTNAFFAPYWDDLQPFGTNIRYGTVGTSPNRTFVIDYEMDQFSGSEGSDDLRFQVQIHERSSLVSVRYRDKQSSSTGTSATIGFQGAGGASAVAYPLGFNARTLDDNDTTDEGWSIHPKAGGAMSLHSILSHSPDDISGFTTLSGDDVTANAALPFTLTLDGVGYTTLTLSTNGWIEFGGNTSGSADFNNTCLPVANHTNPFLAAYWDDMVTAATNVRYGTVGTSPNRIFIAEYYLLTFAADDASNDDIQFQVEVHERSNTINVKYHFNQNVVNGQNATIGYQGAGGAAATTVAPLTCNGKILDDNRSHEGWSIAPLPICGNSLTETKEQCDQGAANGTATSCCSSTCQFVAGGTTCRATAGVCDVAETCSGSAGTCPADAFVSSATVCRAAVAGGCDVAENCSGSAAACPADVVQPAGTTCRVSAGVCDVAETCNGVANTCPADAFVSSATVCRAAVAGGCDVAENCSGSGALCPADAVQPAGTTCRVSAGVCDVAETCNGVANTCPADAFVSSATVCRAAVAGGCDVAENCSGSAAACPADVVQPAGTSCRVSAGVCDVAETCNGIANTCPADAFVSSATVCRAAVAGGCDVAENCSGSAAACPADVVQPAGTSCRVSAGVCDVAETCDGVANTCPADAFVSSATVCRAAVAGGCDVAENCSGSAAACPADVVQPAGTSCRVSAGVCDVAENCDGVANTCPADAFVSSATVCRAAVAGGCDVAENCSGSGALCPADAVQPAGTTCRVSAGVCDVAETCDGVANTCPADAFVSSATVCRAAVAGGCDVAENCSGSAAACPADVVQPAGTSCRVSAGVCDVAETCNGVANTCPADAFVSSATVCRAAVAGGCDVAENCSGSAAACPADVVQPAGTSCRVSAGVCDVAETCNGVANTCPADAFQSSATVCRAAVDVCDAAENCSGSGAACPADAVQPNTTVCRPAAGVCDGAENCDGSSTACPADIVAPATTVCRAAMGACDLAENCDGSTGICPADAVAPATTTCRASTDTCDPAENCDGSTVNCPADALAPATTTCRAAAGVCDLAENCSGTAAACPADAKDSTTVCRAAAAQCDAAEVCDGVNDNCPADVASPDGAACDDGNACLGPDTCQAGACTPLEYVCLLSCPLSPMTTCTGPVAVRGSQLRIKAGGVNPRKTRLKWNVKNADTTSVTQFGDPATGFTPYAVCIYDGGSLVYDGAVLAQGTCNGANACWNGNHRGYRYRDPLSLQDGLSHIKVRDGVEGRTRVLVKASNNIVTPTLDNSLTPPPYGNQLTAQIFNGRNQCWEARFDNALIPFDRNDAGQFRAWSVGP